MAFALFGRESSSGPEKAPEDAKAMKEGTSLMIRKRVSSIFCVKLWNTWPSSLSKLASCTDCESVVPAGQIVFAMPGDC